MSEALLVRLDALVTPEDICSVLYDTYLAGTGAKAEVSRISATDFEIETTDFGHDMWRTRPCDVPTPRSRFIACSDESGRTTLRMGAFSDARRMLEPVCRHFGGELRDGSESPWERIS